eukprot:GFUD01022885.1.p1 GENE.GFUD01022885.1~~GFUD01022885.1.p1  ORF type:complete len:401 (-),score=126.99 GFUD01022885.1:264-1466(-)
MSTWPRFEFPLCKFRGENAFQVKKFLLDVLTKTILPSKSKVSVVSLKQLSPFLRLLTHEEFKTLLLPVMTKAMLRSPEIALSAVGSILASMSLDLSVYVSDLSKTFSTNLRSKDDNTREDAIEATLALGRQCSDQSAVESLLESIFGVLNGSEGKISLNTMKVSLLTAAGGLTESGVTGGGVANLAVVATKLYVKFLEVEAHEGTLVTALEMLANWAAKYSNQIPEQFISWFPKGMALKTTTSGVRSAYLVCLACSLHTNTLSSAVPLIPSLSKVVDNAVKQSAQVAIVSEAVHAAACLVKIAGVDLATEQSLAELLTLVVDTEKCMFYQEKFLAGAGAAALQSLTSLITTLLISHVDKVGSTPTPMLRSLAICMMSSVSSVRRHAGPHCPQIEFCQLWK